MRGEPSRPALDHVVHRRQNEGWGIPLFGQRRESADMPTCQDDVGVHHIGDAVRRTEGKATKRPPVVHDPDMETSALKGRQRKSSHASHVLVMVRAERVVHKHA